MRLVPLLRHGTSGARVRRPRFLGGVGVAFLTLGSLGCATPGPRPVGASVVALPALPETQPPATRVEPALSAVAARYGVSASAVVSSPSGQRLLLVERLVHRDRPRDREDHVLVMAAPDGRELGRYPAALPGLLGDVAFLGEDRATYLVLETLAVTSAHAKAALQKPSVHVVQPLVVDRTPRICRGRAFTFSPDRTHLLHVAGKPGNETIWLDGEEIYPARAPASFGPAATLSSRREGGRSGVTVQGEPVFAPDGKSVAWLERGRPGRLVVLERLEGRVAE
ncbi:MAG TPA: hypothetical protein VIU64_14285, partial [Polyangia bacterium]